ncbi:hypothetical protein NHX12_030727 [Muraenolepis orangiensis]|uniref:Uncharacterized protein n=1 Tax=Muraenolepis orangiensis TaxID=630683 RepID=A0A9Q0IM49_9TELE|nr:hypothetical protein NHX12_030727 [Muraenolepis orangiensis]
MLPSVDLTMSFTQPPAPPASSSSSSSSSSCASLAAMGAAMPHASMLGAPYATALPLSSLLGVKSFPYHHHLALSSQAMGAPGLGAGAQAMSMMAPSHAAAAAALASYTAKISSSANGMKKPDRQKFAPY